MSMYELSFMLFGAFAFLTISSLAMIFMEATKVKWIRGIKCIESFILLTGVSMVLLLIVLSLL